MQTNKNIKGRAIFSDQEEIKERSLKLYMYLVCRANLRNKPDEFGDNVRIFQQKDIVLSKVKRILKIGDERTIKKYWEELERSDLIRFCPRNWREQTFDENNNRIPFNERWKIRNKHKDTYYEIPVTRQMLFRKIPKETIMKLNEDYCVDEIVIKLYMTLVNYQEECILNNKTYKAFTYKDLRDILGYKQEERINRRLEAALNQLRGFGLIDIKAGSFINQYGVKIPVFVLNQANFYIDFDLIDFEPANENTISEKEIKIIKENMEFFQS